MSQLEAVVWADSTIPSDFIDMAESALNMADDQLNLDIYITNAVEKHGRMSVGAPPWRDRPNLEDAKDSLLTFGPDNMSISNDQHHFVLVDQVYLSSGQGNTWGTPGGPKGPWSNYQHPSSCISCVNRGAKIWAEISECYGGMGDMTFQATVMHNLGHGVIPYNGEDDHELGEILNPGWAGNIVSPMQMGYIDAGCSGNSPPDTNCTNNPYAPVNAINNDYSNCAVETIDGENKLVVG